MFSKDANHDANVKVGETDISGINRSLPQRRDNNRKR